MARTGLLQEEEGVRTEPLHADKGLELDPCMQIADKGARTGPLQEEKWARTGPCKMELDPYKKKKRLELNSCKKKKGL